MAKHDIKFGFVQTARTLLSLMLWQMVFMLFSAEGMAAAQVEGNLVVSSNTTPDGINYQGHIYYIEKPGTYTVSMAEGADYTRDVIMVETSYTEGEVNILLDNVSIYPKYDWIYDTAGNYGAPAIWLWHNEKTNVNITYKGECNLKGQNTWSAINKYVASGVTGGTLTIRPYGGEDDILKLEGGHGIGHIRDEYDEKSTYEYFCSDNVLVEGGKITGGMGAAGVRNYRIEGGFHEITDIGDVTIGSGTVIADGPCKDACVTYIGGNFYCKNKEVPVKNTKGERLYQVVLPAGFGLTGMQIDGTFSPCEADKKTENQVYPYMTKGNHTVTLCYDDGRKEDFHISFKGDKPIIQEPVEAVYPKWALLDISKATVTGIPDEVKFTGKRIILDTIKVVLDGYELIEGTDYVVDYNDKNLEEGSCTPSIKGINSFKGYAKSKQFKIVREKEVNIPDDSPAYTDWKDPYEGSSDKPAKSGRGQAETRYPEEEKKTGTGGGSGGSTAITQKTITLSGVKCKKGSKKITGKVSEEGVTVSVKVGKKKYKQATVKGKKFTLKTGKLKKKTKITIKVTKSGCKTLKKTFKVK
ncbi:MAG: hypothetical protein K5739_01610 [Lachnospiraceae bacterium]|nr:hypothetical protein [Lachnospiraceae bacterium]